MVILASKEDHCVADLLHQWRNGDLEADIPLVISNHPDLRPLVEWHDIEFRHVPFTAGRKAEAFAEVASLFDAVRGDVMVLARFMQILPADLCSPLPVADHQHPPQLPALVRRRAPVPPGFRAWSETDRRHLPLRDRRARRRPHHRTGQMRIDHADDIEELLRIGRGIERTVLARGLRWHLEDRVLVNGNRTVVFA